MDDILCPIMGHRMVSDVPRILAFFVYVVLCAEIRVRSRLLLTLSPVNDLIILPNKLFKMVSDCKMCVRDDLWEYKMSFGTYHPDLQIYNVV